MWELWNYRSWEFWVVGGLWVVAAILISLARQRQQNSGGKDQGGALALGAFLFALIGGLVLLLRFVLHRP